MHEPKAGDNYASISREWYNDPRYANALEAFNGGVPIERVRYVNVPPMHVLRKQYPTLVGGAVVPASGSSRPPAAAPSATWGPAGGKPASPSTTSNRPGAFIVPQGGLTMPAIARQVGVRWEDIYDLNPQYRTDVPLPAGTQLKMPASARLP